MGTNIKVARIRKGLNQEQLCELVKISRCTLSRLEQGKLDPKLSLMMKISNVLDASIEELFL